MHRYLRNGVIAAAGLAAISGAAVAGAPGDEEAGPGTVEAVGAEDGRYALRVLYQPERDLNNADPRINVMIDSRTGRSWVLRYTKMPGSHERGYVWVEIPFAPKGAPTN